MGVDYRLPEHREKVFQDFYEFHLRYRSHPGCVYYLLPYLKEKLNWNDEEALWFAFLNGNTQNPVTSYILHKRFPKPEQHQELLAFYRENYARLEFDTDRRYHKKSLEEAIQSYIGLVGNNQRDFWYGAAAWGFGQMWREASKIATFGRLSTFSYLEYLRISGVPFDCDTLFIDDISGSRSHRNGLCIVTGLDRYDWHKSNPDFDGKYSKELLQGLESKGEELLIQAKQRAQGKPWEYDVSYFTLESTLCTYKSWHRPNRRYPNVYNDMLAGRIKKNETNWPEEDLSIFWEARRDCLPAHLRIEDSADDLGLHPIKQNHYRTTGQVIMMDKEYPEYANDYNDAVDKGKIREWL